MLETVERKVQPQIRLPHSEAVTEVLDGAENFARDDRGHTQMDAVDVYGSFIRHPAGEEILQGFYIDPQKVRDELDTALHKNTGRYNGRVKMSPGTPITHSSGYETFLDIADDVARSKGLPQVDIPQILTAMVLHEGLGTDTLESYGFNKR